VTTRVYLRSPDGAETVRDIGNGYWLEPEGTAGQVIGQDMYALPGLSDGHAHFAAPVGQDWQSDAYDDAVRRARLALQAGVLLALDKGWSNNFTVRIIDTVPPLERPDIEAAGIINAVKDGYWPNFARELDQVGFDEGINQSLDDSRGWIKFVGDWPRRGQGPVANFSQEELAKAVAAAEAVGSRVAIHTMARDAPSMAVRAGVHSIEHGLFLTEEDLNELGGRGGMWVPTILRMEAVVTQLGPESSGGKLILEGLDNLRHLLPLAAEAGVHLLAGTDVTVGAHDVALEAQRLVDYGLPVDRALEAVSSEAYRATGRPHAFEVGSPANAVFFPANPLEEFEVLTSPRMVLRLGELVT